jgi:hypothetical protein
VGSDTYAYGGGNLDQTGLNLGVTNLMIYEGRSNIDMVNYALSTNPFFDTVSKVGRLDVPLRNEATIEKFQWVIRNDTLLLFYQLQAPTDQKATVVRKYKAGELPGSKWAVGSSAHARVAAGNLVTCLTVGSSSTADVLSTATYGTNKAVRFRMTSGTTNKIEQAGFRNASATGAGVAFQQNSDGTWSFFTHDGTTSTGVNLGSHRDYGWHTIELARTATKARCELDGVLMEISSTIPTGALKILASGYKGIQGYSTLKDWILVRSYNDPGPSVEIVDPNQPPAVPINVQATVQSRFEVLLTWTDASVNETAFEIYQGVDGENYQLSESTAANATSALVTGLQPSTTYYFVVRAINSAGYNESAAVTATTAANSPPSAQGDSYLLSEDARLTVAAPGVLGNDTDPDGDVLSAVLVSGPSHGTLTLNGNGAFSYLPNTNYNGDDNFAYRASDGYAVSTITTVTLNVAPANDPPVANPDTFNVQEGVATRIDVLANDTDADGETLTVVAVTQGTSGAVSINSDNTLTYQSEAGFTGQDVFTYSATDGAATVVGTVTVNVTPNVLFAEDFESGSFTAGGWTVSGSSTVDPAAAQVGNYGALLKRTAAISKKISPVGLSIVRLSYGRRSAGLESGEAGFVEVSPNGQDWTLVETVSGAKAWETKTFQITLSGSDLYLRFRLNGNESNDTFMVDEVKVSGGTQNSAGIMHVSSIVVKAQDAGKKTKRGYAEVVVLDANDTPVAGANVTGTFSESISETLVSTTGEDGRAVFQTTTAMTGQVRLTFCVDEVAVDDLTYDATANIETCDKSY